MSSGIVGTVITLVIVILSVLFSIVITVISMAVPLAIVFYVFRLLKQNAAQTQQLLETGVQGIATVKGISMGGAVMTVGVTRSMQLSLQLTVDPDPSSGVPPFDIQHSQMVPELAIPAVQPGSTLPVAFDPQNHGRLAINFASLGYG